MDNNPVALWQLIGDWLDQAKLGWKTSMRGQTPLIEKLDDPDWHYYIGDDYVSTYPSCAFGGSRLIAADPEFFAKLEELLVHVGSCYRCAAVKEMDRVMLDELIKSISETTNKMMDMKHSLTQLANAYVLPPVSYSTININTDP